MRCTATAPLPSPTRVYPRRLLQWLSVSSTTFYQPQRSDIRGINDHFGSNALFPLPKVSLFRTNTPFSKLSQDNNAAQENVTLQSVTKEGVEVDMTVAYNELFPGDIALRIPEELVVTLDRIFDGDGPLAELLTTNKLSELAVLTLYLMYEVRKMVEIREFFDSCELYNKKRI